MAAGYSKRPLAEKLGIKPGTRVTPVGVPPEYARLLEPVPADVTFVAQARRTDRHGCDGRRRA